MSIYVGRGSRTAIERRAGTWAADFARRRRLQQGAAAYPQLIRTRTIGSLGGDEDMIAPKLIEIGHGHAALDCGRVKNEEFSILVMTDLIVVENIFTNIWFSPFINTSSLFRNTISSKKKFL